jgi:hypothetical protein
VSVENALAPRERSPCTVVWPDGASCGTTAVIFVVAVVAALTRLTTGFLVAAPAVPLAAATASAVVTATATTDAPRKGTKLIKYSHFVTDYGYLIRAIRRKWQKRTEVDVYV